MMMMMTRKSPRARRNGRRLRGSGDIRPIGNAQVIVSHQKKSGDIMIFEDPEDLDCDGSCEDETTSHVPGKC